MYNGTDRPEEHRCPYDWSHMCAMLVGCAGCVKRKNLEARKVDKTKDCTKNGKSGKHVPHLPRIKVCAKCGKILEDIKEAGYWIEKDN